MYDNDQGWRTVSIYMFSDCAENRFCYCFTLLVINDLGRSPLNSAMTHIYILRIIPIIP